MISPTSKRFTNNLFRVLLRAKGPVNLLRVQKRLQRKYSLKVFGSDVRQGVEELERQGKVSFATERASRYFSIIVVSVSPLYRMAAL